MLNLFKVDNTIKKYGGKRDIIYFNDVWYFKIIFMLLTKIIVVYIRFS